VAILRAGTPVEKQQIPPRTLIDLAIANPSAWSE
jgi:hypothetical protein